LNIACRNIYEIQTYFVKVFWSFGTGQLNNLITIIIKWFDKAKNIHDNKTL